MFIKGSQGLGEDHWEQKGINFAVYRGFKTQQKHLSFLRLTGVGREGRPTLWSSSLLQNGGGDLELREPLVSDYFTARETDQRQPDRSLTPVDAG